MMLSTKRKKYSIAIKSAPRPSFRFAGRDALDSIEACIDPPKF